MKRAHREVLTNPWDWGRQRTFPEGRSQEREEPQRIVSQKGRKGTGVWDGGLGQQGGGSPSGAPGCPRKAAPQRTRGTARSDPTAVTFKPRTQEEGKWHF